MKVLNITMHAVDNYGSVLQTYATEQLFRKLGCEVETLNYIQNGLQLDSVSKIIRNGGPGWKIKCKQLVLHLIQPKHGNARKKVMEDFRKKYLHLTKHKYLSTDELKSDVPTADIYCTGSDQTWNTTLHGVSDVYFLTFAPAGKKRIAFSASFGVSSLPQKDQEAVKKRLANYTAISVREESGLAILKELGVDNAQWVLDPTLAVMPDCWYDMAADRMIDKEYIFVYQLNTSETFADYVNKFSKSKGLDVFYVKSRKEKSLQGTYIECPTPEMLLSYFRYSSYVITDSFHATVFSLIFHREFLIIYPPHFPTRLESLLCMIGLEKRHVADFTRFDYDNEHIDYEKVGQIIELKQKETLGFLKNAIR